MAISAAPNPNKKRERGTPDAITVARRVVRDYAALPKAERAYVRSKMYEMEQAEESAEKAIERSSIPPHVS